MRRIAFLSPISNGYVHRLAQGAFARAEASGGLTVREFLMPGKSLGSRDESDPLGLVVAWQPDGILSFLEDEDLTVVLAKLPAPCPVVSMCAVRQREGAAIVCGSFPSAARATVDHFRELGLRSMTLFSCGLDDVDSERIFICAAKPFAEIPGPFREKSDPAILHDPYQPVLQVSGSHEKWLRDLPKPSGILCPWLGGGSYLIRVCKLLGLRVPEDFAIVGTDDGDHAMATNPTLTSVVPMANRIGSEAARLLARMMEGQPAPKKGLRLNAIDLKVRDSTGRRRKLVCDIAGALDHIDLHACRGLAAGELHQATQEVCGKTFYSHFKIATGMTPGEAIQRRQIEEVRRLLVSTQLSITRIAENCGFNSSSDLARRFRAFTGVSPSAFRKKSSPPKPVPRLPDG